MNENVLIKFSDNWADEMDVEGFVIRTRKDWENAKAKVMKVFEYRNFGHEVYFGTNEMNEYSSYDEFLQRFQIKNITDEETWAFIKFFGPTITRYPFGHCPWNHFNDTANEIDEELGEDIE